ncbi:hypothetical protein NKG94_01435 [Micromonospora sp. M12]
MVGRAVSVPGWWSPTGSPRLRRPTSSPGSTTVGCAAWRRTGTSGRTRTTVLSSSRPAVAGEPPRRATGDLAGAAGPTAELARLCGWSLVESLPALLAGYLVARAVDDGFLAGRLLDGLAWLGSSPGPCWSARRPPVGRTGVSVRWSSRSGTRWPRRWSGRAARRHPGGWPPDSAAVTRLTHQMEIVRDTFAGLLMVTRGFVFSAGAALLGLLALAPVVAALAAAPLVAGLVVFLVALPSMVTHQRAYVRAGEQLGQSAAAALAGHRDVLACGAQTRVTADVERGVSAQAAAERMLARMAAIRSLSLGIGGWLPLLVLMATARGWSSVVSPPARCWAR